MTDASCDAIDRDLKQIEVILGCRSELNAPVEYVAD